MSDTEWFSGRSVDEPPCEQRYAPHRFAAVLFVAGLVLALLLGCASTPQPAVAYVHDSHGLRARLLNKPCDDPRVMEMLQVGIPQIVDRFKVVEAEFRMRAGGWKHYRGCWAELSIAEVGFEAIAMLFEDADFYIVDKAEFLGKPKPKGTDV